MREAGLAGRGAGSGRVVSTTGRMVSTNRLPSWRWVPNESFRQIGTCRAELIS